VPEGSVVIINFRTPELVERCLRSIAADPAAEGLELVVLDNGSADGSVQRLAAAGLPGRLVGLDDNRGFAAAVNAAMRTARHDRVVVLNADTEVRPGALTALLGALDDPGVGVAAPLLEHPDGRLQVNAYRRFPTLAVLAFELSIAGGYLLALTGDRLPHPMALTEAAHARGGDVEHVMGAALAVQRAAWEQTGGLDEDFFLYLEETEWQRRLRAAGRRVVLVPAARVMHHVRAGDPTTAVPSPHYVDSAFRYLAKAYGIPPRRAAPVLAAALALAWLTTWTTALRGPEGRVAARAMRERIAVLWARVRAAGRAQPTAAPPSARR
jgi:GT2 family glycosyltransferase